MVEKFPRSAADDTSRNILYKREKFNKNFLLLQSKSVTELGSGIFLFYIKIGSYNKKSVK